MLTYFKVKRTHKNNRLRRLRLLKKRPQTEPEPKPEEEPKKKKLVHHWMRDIATDNDFNYRCYVSVDESNRATIQLARHEEGCCFGRPAWTYNKCDCVDFDLI